MQESVQEIKEWSSVTVRLANLAAMQELDEVSCKKRCLDMRSKVRQERWKSAKVHIP